MTRMNIPDFFGSIQHDANEKGERVATGRQEVRRIALEKVRLELADLERAGVVVSGYAFSEVLLVKGEQGPAERAGEGLLRGADGRALKAALLKLGYAPESWLALATWDAGGQTLDAALLRRAVLVLDPTCLIVLDEAAADVVRLAYATELAGLTRFEEAMLQAGSVAEVQGMRVLNLGGFEAALASPHEKQVMWARLKRLPPEGSPY